MENKMKFSASLVGCVMFIAPFGFLFVLFGTIFLEMGFGISPPVGLAASCFFLAMLFSLFWYAITAVKNVPYRSTVKTPKRLLRVRYLADSYRN